MARVPYLDQSDLAPEHRDLLARNINLFRAMVHSPHGARAFHGLGEFIRHKSRLDPRLRELAILQVGYLTRSVYEYTHHIKIGRGSGVSDDDIRAIAAETAGRPSSLEPLARTVLLAARRGARRGARAPSARRGGARAARSRGAADDRQLDPAALTGSAPPGGRRCGSAE
jgi:alkylhydroperoxidase family enzyme